MNGTMDSPEVTVGETIAALEPGEFTFTLSDAVHDVWALQGADYDYATNSCSGLCKDYLQVTFLLLPPAMKLGEGYVFTRVCDSVHRGEYLGRYPPGTRYTRRDQVHSPRTRYPRTRYPPGAVHAGRYRQHAGGKHPTGMHSCWFINIQLLLVFPFFGQNRLFVTEPRSMCFGHGAENSLLTVRQFLP